MIGSRTKKLQAAGALVVVVLGALAYAVFFRHASPDSVKASDAAAAAPNVPIAVARVGDFEQRVSAQGRIGAPAGSSAKLAFAQAGILRSVNVQVGQRVGAGSVLAALDRGVLGAAVVSAQGDAAAAATAQSAHAKVLVAQAKLAVLERNGPAALSARISAESAARQAAIKVAADAATVARDVQLLAAGVVAGKDVDAARAQQAADEADRRAADAKVAAAGADFRAALQQARADVTAARSDERIARGQALSAQGRLQTARLTYENGILRAPSDGVIIGILKHPGEAVDPSTPVIEIGPALGHVVTLTVAADVAQRVAVGDPVSMRIASRGAGTVGGTVSAVVPAVDPATQTATITVDGAPADAVSGDAVTATIVTGRLHGVLVPATAIVQDPQTGKTVVFVHVTPKKDGDPTFSMRGVSVRASDAATAVIASGVRAGEPVAARGGYMLLAPAGGG
jgi:multidrug efflux pump subunit AcrA (membrane-fusion protein)